MIKEKEHTPVKKKRIQLQKLHFQLMPYDTLRRDSPIVIHIPMRDDWVDYNRQIDAKWTPLYWDLAECYECQLISIKHLEAIMNWRDENTTKEEIDLSD